MLSRSLYIFGAKLVGYGLRLLLPYFLVRALAMADFGAYRQFFLLEVYIAALFQFGVNQALYYFVPRDRENAGAYLVNSLVFNVVAYTLAFLVIGLNAARLAAWLNMPILVDAFWPLAFYTLLIMFTVAGDCYFNAQQHVKIAAGFEIAGQVLASIATLVAAFVWRDVVVIVRALVLARAVTFVAMAAYIHFRLHGLRARRYFFGLWRQVRHGVTLGAAGTLWIVLERWHEFYVSRQFGTEAYAVYGAGCLDLPVLQMAAQSLAVVALAEFARLEQEGDWEGIRQLWRRILASMVALAVPTTVALVALARPLIVFWFTPAYAAAVPIFQISTLAKLHLAFNATLVLRAMNRNDVSLLVNVAVLVATPFALALGMASGGMVGIIAAQAVLLIGGRLAAVVVLNRVSGARLAYLVRPGEVLAVYGDAARRTAAFGRRWAPPRRP